MSPDLIFPFMSNLLSCETPMFAFWCAAAQDNFTHCILASHESGAMGLFLVHLQSCSHPFCQKLLLTKTCKTDRLFQQNTMAMANNGVSTQRITCMHLPRTSSGHPVVAWRGNQTYLPNFKRTQSNHQSANMATKTQAQTTTRLQNKLQNHNNNNRGNQGTGRWTRQ